MEIKKIPDFLKGADNVYRTKHYIVKQQLRFFGDQVENEVVSYDTYYICTERRKALYLLFLAGRADPCGRRLPTTIYKRRYID